MQFAECVMQRYATKKFDGRTIPDAKVNELLELVRYAPSALNLQPWKIKVVTDKKVKEPLRPVSNDQEQITTCSHLLVFCADSDYDALNKRLGALMKANHVPDEVVENGYRHGSKVCRQHDQGTAGRVVAGPDLPCARECLKRCKVARL